MKKNYIVLAAYMIIMGVGLFICNQFLNTPYNTTEFSRKFLPFMIILFSICFLFLLVYKLLRMLFYTPLTFVSATYRVSINV